MLNAGSRFAHRVQQVTSLALEIERVRTGDVPPQVIDVEVTESVADTIRAAEAMLANLKRDAEAYPDDHAAGPAAAQPDAAWPPSPQRPQSGHMTCASCGGATLIKSGSHPDPNTERYGCPRCGSHFLSTDHGLHLYEDLDNARVPIAQA
jgi:hypothetical protein